MDPAVGTCIHISALDGIVNVNSLFTLAVFIGLAWDPRDQSNILLPGGASDPCAGGSAASEAIVTFHVYSFSSFLFSSLIALGLKQAIRISRYYESYRAYIHKAGLRVGMLLSAVGSVCGCAFLMMALVNVAQMKLGKLSCATSHHTFAAVVPLLIFVPSGLLIYVFFVFYAFTR